MELGRGPAQHRITFSLAALCIRITAILVPAFACRVALPASLIINGIIHGASSSPNKARRRSALTQCSATPPSSRRTTNGTTCPCRTRIDQRFVHFRQLRMQWVVMMPARMGLKSSRKDGV